MKKLHPLVQTALLAGTTLTLPSVVSADTILGIYGGAGVWDVSIDGSFGVDEIPITTTELGIEDTQSNFFYLALEHPIPIIPNVRIQHTQLENTGSAVVEREFTWEDISFPAQALTTTKLDLTQTDFTLYYEILDNWVSLDLGLTAKILDGYASIRSEPDGLEVIEEETDLNGALPMLYGKFRFDLPLTGLYADGQLNYISYDNSTISDVDVKLGWMFESVLDVGAELGYRQFKMELNEFDDANADLSYDGPYLNVAIHF